MKKIDIKNNLKSALEKSTPNCFEEINNGVYVNQINFNIDDMINNKKKAFCFNLRYVMAISTCLLLIIIGLGTYYVPVNDIYLDVNPSIEIKTNLFDRVIVVKAMNDDGTSITNSIDIKNKNIDVAIDNIMNEMISQGYINSELNDNAILISFNVKSEEQANKISESIDNSLNNKLNEENITAVVLTQELNSMKDLQELSKETGVSVGRLQFIQKMIEQNDVEIDVNSLYDLKIKELLAYAEKNNISVEKIVDNKEEFTEDNHNNDADDKEDSNKYDDEVRSKNEDKDRDKNKDKNKDKTNDKLDKENKKSRDNKDDLDDTDDTDKKDNKYDKEDKEDKDGIINKNEKNREDDRDKRNDRENDKDEEDEDEKDDDENEFKKNGNNLGKRKFK